MLTKADVEILRAPFKPDEIEFLRGYAYVREQAVNNRLSEVDPAWCMHISAWEYRSDAHVVVMGSMTLNEATRYGVGEQANEAGAGKPTKPLDCAKGAATDLLKRLARLFHVGLYLTELGDVKTIEAYTAWYNKEKGITPPLQQQQRPPAPQSQPSQQPTVYNAPPATDGDTKIYTCERITVLKRPNGFQYIAHCGHNVNIVTFSRELYRKTFGGMVEGWNVDVTAKGKSIPCNPAIHLKARVNGANLELVEVLAS